jgi:hypothetical protein
VQHPQLVEVPSDLFEVVGQEEPDRGLPGGRGDAADEETTVGRLVAATFGLSAHIQTDHFMSFVASGWVEPHLADAAHQNHVLGGAVAAAALQFATGGYMVVVDGHIFPEGLDGLAHHSVRRGVTLHYAVLRPDLATCLTRVRQRRQGDPERPRVLHPTGVSRIMIDVPVSRPPPH